jgi:hypothetical protein
MSKCSYNPGSNFDRQGQWIIAKYMGECFVTGVVQETRVKYGGTVQHTIVSDSPAVITHSGEVRPIGTTFLVEEENVTHAEFFVEFVFED